MCVWFRMKMNLTCASEQTDWPVKLGSTYVTAPSLTARFNSMNKARLTCLVYMRMPGGHKYAWRVATSGAMARVVTAASPIYLFTHKVYDNVEAMCCVSLPK